MGYSLIEIKPFHELSRSTLKYIDICEAIAHKSDFDSSKRLGACIKLNGDVVAGPNVHKQTGNIYSVHAEINALSQYFRKYKKRKPITLYVVRLLNNTDGHKFGFSRPCEACQQRMAKDNVTCVYYTDIVDNKQVLCKIKLF